MAYLKYVEKITQHGQPTVATGKLWCESKIVKRMLGRFHYGRPLTGIENHAL